LRGNARSDRGVWGRSGGALGNHAWPNPADSALLTDWSKPTIDRARRKTSRRNWAA